MKKILFASSFLLVLLSACSDYNDQFSIKDNLTDVKNMALTLEPADYSSIAQLSANQELALSKDPENKTYVTALNAVGTNKYFTEDALGEDYLPAYLSSKYPNADATSKFVVTYNMYQAPAAYLADFKNISTYTLTSDDYKTVWGDNISASFLSPASISKIPALLKSNVTNAASGDMKVVYYAYSSVEPSTGGNSGEVSYTKLSEVVANTAGAEYTVKGEVVAIYARGFLLSDGTATMLVYLNAYPNYSVGDVVSVFGTTSKYSGLMQFPAASEVTLLERNTTFAYPSAQNLDATALDALASSPSVKYVSFTGKLSISGNYYNVVVGSATHKGSVSYPVSGIVNSDLNGQDVTVTGYFIGSSSSYANVMATSVVASGATPANTPIGVVALSTAGTYTVTGTVAETYSRGFLLSDGTGNILVYKSNTGVNKGDLVTVAGATSKYAGLMQYSTSATVTVDVAGQKTIARSPITLDAKGMEAYLTTPYIAYVSYEGTLSISGSYYNVIVDGTTTVQGSLSYPVTGLIDSGLNGKKVKVEGYAIGVSSGKYLNTMVTSLVEATTTKSLAARVTTRSREVASNAAALYVYDGSAWSAYTNNDAKVTVVSLAIYTSLGSEAISNPDYVLPIYLANLYPFAEEGDKVTVVYNSAPEISKAVEYTYSKGAWAATPAYAPVTVTFTKDESGISAQTSTYLSETFLGDEGGFTIQDVALAGVTYVWTNTSSYGWKATAFASNTNNPAESWIVSPAINFKKAVAPMMTFEEAHRYLNNEAVTDHFSVLISTDYSNDVTKATWTSLEVPNWSDGASWDFVNIGDIDLSAYVGQTVYVAFKYVSNSTAAPTWEIKNLIIEEKQEETAE